MGLCAAEPFRKSMNAQQADGDDGGQGRTCNLQGEMEMTGTGGRTCNLLQGDEEVKEEEAVKDTR